jgi:hypothetical protein
MEARKDMKTTYVSIVVVIAGLVVANSQGSQAQHQAPSLFETKEWLENSLSLPTSSMITISTSKTVLGIRFIAGDGSSDCFVDIFTNGVDLPTHNGMPSGLYPDYPLLRLNELFSLKDIDPNSIKFTPGVIDWTPGNPTIVKVYSEVTFSTTNNINRITQIVQDISDRKVGEVRLYNDAGGLPLANSSLAESSKISEVRLHMHTDYAPRFVAALRHAVELCGGKASPF